MGDNTMKKALFMHDSKGLDFISFDGLHQVFMNAQDYAGRSDSDDEHADFNDFASFMLEDFAENSTSLWYARVPDDFTMYDKCTYNENRNSLMWKGKAVESHRLTTVDEIENLYWWWRELRDAIAKRVEGFKAVAKRIAKEDGIRTAVISSIGTFEFDGRTGEESHA
jgi:hypothetical protein